MTQIRQSAVTDLAEDYRAYVERARQHYAQHGDCPPDPLLDESMRCAGASCAQHGNDWRKVKEHYIRLGEKHPNRVVQAKRPVDEVPPAA